MTRGWCRRGPAEAGADVGEGVDGLHHARVGGVVEGVDPVAYLVDDVDLPLARRHSPSVPIAILARRRPWQDRRPWAGSTGLSGIDGRRIDGLRKFGGRSDRRMNTACERIIPSLVDEWTTQSRRSSSRADVGARRADGLRFAFYGRMSTAEYQDRASSRAWQREAADRLVAGHGAVQVEFFDEGCSRRLPWSSALRLLRCWPSWPRRSDGSTQWWSASTSGRSPATSSQR